MKKAKRFKNPYSRRGVSKKVLRELKYG